jgi:hypothetical protein
METHSQELHKAPGIGWKHYLFEFFMLFLAVFCGFLAENVREHLVEQSRANEYAKNLYNELKKDTATLNQVILFTQKIIKRLDTLNLLVNNRPAGMTNGTLYYYSMSAAGVQEFPSISSTIEQLKSSGSLRIMKTNVVQKITDYDKLFKLLTNEYALSRTEYETMNQLRLKIFDGFFYAKIYPFAFKDHVPDSLLKFDPPLLNDDIKLMKEFANWASWSGALYRSQIRTWLEPLNKTATELIALLQKEYDLKNE